MIKTPNLKLPIYNTPTTDKFNLEDWNNANDNLEKSYVRVLEIGDNITTINADAEIIEARQGEPTLGKKVIKIDKNVLDIFTDNYINAKYIIGLDNTGKDDIGAKLQAFLDNPLLTGTMNIYFPKGTYKWDTNVTTSKSLNLKSEKDCASFQCNNENVLTANGYLYIDGLGFTSNQSVATKHTVIATGAHCFVYNCYFGSTTGKMCGLSLDGCVIGAIDSCVFNVSQLSINCWDIKVSNTWVWAQWQNYGIKVCAGSGNINFQNVDVVPPFRTNGGTKDGTVIDGQKAGIWIAGEVMKPVSNIIFKDVYIDGGVSDSTIGILSENAFNVTINGRCNLTNSTPIVIDTCYGVNINGFMFDSNDKFNQGMNEIIVRKSYEGTVGQVNIEKCIFSNFYTRTTPTPAIKISTEYKNNVSIENNNFLQNGTMGAYGSEMVDIEIAPLFLYTNKSNTNKFAYKGAGQITPTDGVLKVINLPLPMAKVPNQEDITINFKGVIPKKYRINVISKFQFHLYIESAYETNVDFTYTVKLGNV